MQVPLPNKEEADFDLLWFPASLSGIRSAGGNDPDVLVQGSAVKLSRKSLRVFIRMEFGLHDSLPLDTSRKVKKAALST